MKITIHRPNQIGGCITEIESKKGTRIIIDVGSNLPGNTDGVDVNVAELTKGCDGVFITHYHGDHVGEFHKVSQGVPIYIGGTAKKMLRVLHSRLEKIEKGHLEKVEDLKPLPIGKTAYIDKYKDLTVTAFLVDHSALDAYMFLIESKSEDKRILHTGDFRTHGPRGGKLVDMLAEYVGKVDAIIIEGTMLSRDIKTAKSEWEISREIYDIIENKEGDPYRKNVFVLCSTFNIDTIAGIYQSMKNMQPWKPFVVDSFQREILQVVTDNAGMRTGYYKFNFKGKGKVYTYSATAENNNGLHKEMDNRGFCMFVRANPNSKHFARAMERYPKNTLIYSMWEGYIEKDNPGKNEDIFNFVEKSERNGSKKISIHTSGHATEDAIIQVCETIKPNIILPIHSEETDRFEKLSNESIKGRVKRLKHGEAVEI